MALPLYSLPNVPLQMILSEISLSEIVFNLGAVCNDLRVAQRAQLAVRHTLMLYDESPEQLDELAIMDTPYGQYIVNVLRDNGLPWIQHPSREHLEFNALSLVVARGHRFVASPLMGLMPNIRHLSLVLDDVDDFFHSVPRLLTTYSDTLVSLKLHLNNQVDPYPVENARVLINSINQLVRLEHLALFVRIPGRQQVPELTILNRLHSFTTARFNPRLLANSLVRHANGQIRLDCDVQFELRVLLGGLRHLARQFVSACLSDTFVNQVNVDLGRFCAQYSSLVNLSAELQSMSMIMFAGYLSRLPNLVQLNVSVLEVPMDIDPLPAIVPVPSVRYITLDIHSVAHTDTERLRLAQLYPNLQVLNFIYSPRECGICNFIADPIFINRRHIENHRARRAACRELARIPFGQCVHLHSVIYD